MPTYEFQCEHCGYRWEVQQHVGDPPPKVCPHCCLEDRARKLISLSSFVLKGGRWGKDGYAG